MLSTFLHSTWEMGRVNMIFSGTRVITTRHFAPILECTYKSLCNVMCHMDTGGEF